MNKLKKISIFILVQALLVPYGALAGQLYERADLPAALSPRIQLQVSTFQSIYQKSFQPALNETTVLAAAARSFKEHEDILYEFGSSPQKRDFSCPDIYTAASAILDKLYSDKKAARNYIPVFRKNTAAKKLKILSIALFIELFRSAQFYDVDILNAILDKIMKESLIRSARYRMATANFHYYVNLKNPNWFEMLWISILHELGHNIRFNVINDSDDIPKSRHVASISEFFADLCPYIVSMNKNWVDLILILKKESRRKYKESKKANRGVLLDPHLASQAQWYRLLRGVSLYSSRENLSKLVAIFHVALSEKYRNVKKFTEWIYQINGLGARLRKLRDGLPASKTSHEEEEILLADFSINSTQVKDIANNGDTANQRDAKNNIRAFRSEIVVHGRPFVVLCQISKMIERNEGIMIKLRILNDKKEELLKTDTALSNIKFPREFFLRHILPVLSKQWNVSKKNRTTLSIKNPHYFQLEFASVNDQAIVPQDRIVSVFKGFFSNKLRRRDGTKMDVSFCTERTKDAVIFPDSDLEEIAAILGYKSSIMPPKSADPLQSFYRHKKFSPKQISDFLGSPLKKIEKQQKNIFGRVEQAI